MPYPDDGERLFQIYSKDLDRMMATHGKRTCHCEFHRGQWSGYNSKTTSGIDLTGTDGCLINATIKVTGFMTAKATLKTGYNCSKCNFKNDYAASNQPNGTYLCYECR